MDRNLSPSASLEANAVKAELTYNAASKPEKGGRGIVRRIREAIDPVASAQLYADAAKVVSEGVSQIAQELRDAGTPAHLATAQAYEIYRGASKLTHVGRALEYAEDSLEPDKEYTTPSQEFVNDYTEAVEDVGDDEILKLFGKVLAGEMERPGSFSKKTLSILKDMSREDAESFKRLCRHCIGGEYVNENGEVAYFYSRPFLLPNENGSSYNCGQLPLEEVRNYEMLGLILPEMYDVFRIQPGVGQLIVINGKTYGAKNVQDEYVSMHLGPYLFSKWGAELATLCDLGDAPELLLLVRNIATKQGLVFSEVDLSDECNVVHYTHEPIDLDAWES